MIGTMPRYRPLKSRPRRTVSYTRDTRRSPQRTRIRAPAEAPVNNEIVLFDHPAPLPVAKVHARSVASLASRLRGAREAGWRWLRPRAAPAAVAIVGMLAVLGATNYLTQLATHTPVPSTPAGAIVTARAELPSSDIAYASPWVIITKTEITSQNAPAITIDSEPVFAGAPVDLPSSNCQIHLQR